MAARTEVRKADLGAHEGARFRLPSKTGSRGRDPSYRREISLRLSDLCPRHDCRATGPLRRQDRHHRGRSAPHRPPREEAIAYDVASTLVDHGVLPELNYRLAVQTFGQHGAAELIYLVGLYCLVSVTLNGFDVPVPEPSAA